MLGHQLYPGSNGFAAEIGHNNVDSSPMVTYAAVAPAIGPTISGVVLDTLDWRWMFIIEGLPAVLWAFVWWRLADDRPAQAKWLSDQEKQDLESALAAEFALPADRAIKKLSRGMRSAVTIIGGRS